MDTTSEAPAAAAAAEDPLDTAPAGGVPAPAAGPAHRGPGLGRRLGARGRDALGLAWVTVAGVATLIPALVHGSSIGPYDQMVQYGLLRRPGTSVHYLQGADQINLFIPWTALSWTQVHHGHLPLWNPYSVMGMPLMFNWESAPFGLPAMIGYLFPLHLATTASLVATLLIAGSGTYVLGRVIGLGVIGSAMAATVFELSGPFMGLLAWPVAGVMCWAGWIFAAVILVVRGRKRVRNVVLLAVVAALAVYGGQPELLLLLGMCIAAFLIVYLAVRARRRRTTSGVAQPLIDLVLAAAAGAALSAPLLLPGLQVASGSLRSRVQNVLDAKGSAAQALSAHDLTHLAFQTFDGIPVAGSHSFGDHLFYIDTVAYVGVIALVLAVVGLVRRRRSPVVLGFGAVALVMGAIVFSPPVVSALDHLPVAGGVLWNRALVPLTFGIAVLAGVGAHEVVRAPWIREARRWLAGCFVAAAVVLALLWLVGRGHLPPADAHIRNASFVWPVIATGSGLAVALVLTRLRTGPEPGRGRRSPAIGRWAAGSLLACETAFLVAAGAPIWSSSSSFLVSTPAEQALKQTAGGALVGFGAQDCIGTSQLGIRQNVNVGYGIDEFAVYDPITPRAYFNSWRNATGQPGGYPGAEIYCPGVTTAALARHYGIAYVLEHHGAPGPDGGSFARTVGSQDLYRIPGAAIATVSDLGRNGAFPALEAPARPVPAVRPDPASLRITTAGHTAHALRIHVTAVPGWTATIDGRPLRLHRYDELMLQARVPGGRHVVVLRYWPATFTLGLVLAMVAAIALTTASLMAWATRRRGRLPHRAAS